MKEIEAELGQWYETRNKTRLLCVQEFRMEESSAAFVQQGQWGAIALFGMGVAGELTHLPDCTGWDWQPPKPAPKYRPFANMAEFDSAYDSNRRLMLRFATRPCKINVLASDNDGVWLLVIIPERNPQRVERIAYDVLFDAYAFDDESRCGVRID